MISDSLILMILPVIIKLFIVGLLYETNKMYNAEKD
jgi:hypothetical protein